jgi:hypothetical protein
MSLERLVEAVEEARREFKFAETFLEAGMDYRAELEGARKLLEEAERLARRLLGRVRRARTRRHLEDVARFSRLARGRISRLLSGEGREEDWWEAHAYLAAAHADALFAAGKLRRGAPVPDGAEDLLVPDVPERETPWQLREAEEELGRELDW